MEDEAVTIPEIRALVAERQRFDDWLTALEDRRAETPERVFERVHADYVARRDAVIDNLHTHVGSLETLERDLDNRLQSLEAQLAEREDARAEGMLRTAVGEFDSERWEATRVEVEEAIAQLGTDREALLTEIEDVRALLVSARHKPGIPAPEAEPEPLVVAGVPDLEPELVSPNVAQAIAHVDPAVAEHGVNLDAEGETTRVPDDESGARFRTDPYQRAAQRNAEAESDIEAAFAVDDEPFQTRSNSRDVPAYPFTETPSRDDASVNDAARVDVDHANADRANADHANADHADADHADASRELNEAIDAIGAAPGATAPNSLDDIDVFGESTATPRATRTDLPFPRSNNDPYAPRAKTPAEQAPASGTDAGSASTGGMPKRDEFDDLAFLRSVTDSGSNAGAGSTRTGGSAEQTKTLRCTECGTMNFPTEWYCERCGGELATF